MVRVKEEEGTIEGEESDHPFPHLQEMVGEEDFDGHGIRLPIRSARDPSED